MVIYTKNKILKTKVFSKMKTYDNLALSLYKLGKIAEGRKQEKKSDDLYKKTYHKIFGKRK